MALPAVADTPVGDEGASPLTVYESVDGLVSPLLLVGVRVINPATVGVMVNVCALDEFENVNTVAESPVEPLPVGVIVIVPV